ncbi:ribonuclease domain-containing protein [Aeromicrobium sp.]|uniref:ribonuclease domain-containing protein n=1 Tax=Aeromicrobium sp. TaxID=1871063 RepID=UPI003C5ED656
MRRAGWIVLLLLVGAVLVGLSVSDHDSSADRSAAGPSASHRPDPSPTAERPSQGLPREARQTIDLIRSGGPYPYDRDGTVFMNRERLLPQRPRGYWREYTVPTPGQSSRGARRIVAGEGGELYYTDDHYRSFRRLKADAR